MKQSPQLILALEAAVAGGSVSLIRDGREVAGWIGDGSVSKAEDLLGNIDAVLRSAGTTKHELGMIAVAAGPGSFTGIRIGVATALGLKNGLDIPMASQSTLRAMAFGHKIRGRVAGVLPVGRNAVCFQGFTTACGVPVPLSEPCVIAEDELAATVRSQRDVMFLLHPKLASKVEPLPNAEIFEPKLAFAVGIACEGVGGTTPPIFLSKTF